MDSDADDAAYGEDTEASQADDSSGTDHPDYSHIDLFHVDPSVLGIDPSVPSGLQNLGTPGQHALAADPEPGTDLEAGGVKVHLEATDDGHGIHLNPLPNVQVTVSPAHQEYDPHNPLSDWVPSFTPILEVGGDPPDPAHPDEP